MPEQLTKHFSGGGHSRRSSLTNRGPSFEDDGLQIIESLADLGISNSSMSAVKTSVTTATKVTIEEGIYENVANTLEKTDAANEKKSNKPRKSSGGITSIGPNAYLAKLKGPRVKQDNPKKDDSDEEEEEFVVKANGKDDNPLPAKLKAPRIKRTKKTDNQATTTTTTTTTEEPFPTPPNGFDIGDTMTRMRDLHLHLASQSLSAAKDLESVARECSTFASIVKVAPDADETSRVTTAECLEKFANQHRVFAGQAKERGERYKRDAEEMNKFLVVLTKEFGKDGNDGNGHGGGEQQQQVGSWDWTVA